MECFHVILLVGISCGLDFQLVLRIVSRANEPRQAAGPISPEPIDYPPGKVLIHPSPASVVVAGLYSQPTQPA
jgi:hypothetical protein